MKEHFWVSAFPQQDNIQRDDFALHAGTLQLFLEGALYLPPLWACIAWRVLVPGWMTLLTVFLLPRAACLAAEVQTAVIYHAKHEGASFLWNIFSYWEFTGQLFDIFGFICTPCTQESPFSTQWCQMEWESCNIELPVRDKCWFLLVNMLKIYKQTGSESVWSPDCLKALSVDRWS